MKTKNCATVWLASWAVLRFLGSSAASAEPRPQISLTNRVPAAGAAGPQALAPDTEQKGSSTAPGPLDLLDIDAAIRELYGRFSAISKASGQEISFVISGITTYRGQQLEEVRWLDLFTWQPGPNIEAVPHSRSTALPSQETVTYRLAWKDGRERSEQMEAFGRGAARFSAAEALELLIANEPDRFSGTVALTSFEVEVHLEGRSRAYRALVSWKPLGAESVLFTLADHVVSDVDVAFHEDRIIVKPDAPREPPPVEQGSHNRFVCSPRVFDIHGSLQNLTRFEGHSTGNHNSSLRVSRTCRATSDCTSTCEPYQSFDACTEWGSTGLLYWHKVSVAATTSSVDGYGAGVSSNCGYAKGCAFKECLFGACGGLTFGISGVGASVVLRALGGPIGDLSQNSGGNCPAAQIVDPPDPPDPPGCGETSANVVALDLERGGEPVQLGRAEIPLYYSEPSNETHHGQPVRYLMAEWAVVSVPGLVSRDSWSPKPFMRSSEAFDEATANALVGAISPQLQGEVSADTPRPVLLVALPSHEANSRQIAMPELRISGNPPPKSGQRGQVLLLADFAEDHRLQRLVLLHDTLGGVPRELMLHFERTLSLATPTTEKHRVVAFALFSVGATIEIDSLIPYLPRCCCGDTFCM